ncbi:ARP4 [Symbiodinium microadriaticum]|nr:ARP4 [Symbiodinium microadriaticum]
MYHSKDDIGAIVADIGSTSTRVGFAGDDVPRAYLPSCVGVTTDEDANSVQYHCDISYFRENMRIQHAMRDGLVSDWDALQQLWEHSVASYLKVDLKETPVLFAEKVYNSSTSRQKLCEMMFETYDVPALFIGKDSALSCYSCGKTSGVVVDCGGSGTVVTPVNDGWSETSAISRGPVGGRHMDAYMLQFVNTQMQQLYGLPPPKPLFRLTKTVTEDGSVTAQSNGLRRVHPTYDAYMALELGRDIKESVCRMVDSSSALLEGDPRYVNMPLIPYVLPDGTVLDIGPERFQAPELLLDPARALLDSAELETLGLSASSPGGVPFTTDPVQKLILDTVLRCEADAQAAMVSNLIICGGNAGFEGTPERIRNEVERIVHANAPTWKIRMVAASSASERTLSTWIGGSILGSLGSLHEMWMGRSEYDEYGSALVDKKCP